MKRQLAAIQSRRRTLLTRIAEQRAQVAQFPLRLKQPLAVADWAFKAGRLVYKHPLLLTGALSLLLTLRRNGMMAMWLLGWRLLQRNPVAAVKGYRYLTRKPVTPPK